MTNAVTTPETKKILAYPEAFPILAGILTGGLRKKGTGMYHAGYELRKLYGEERSRKALFLGDLVSPELRTVLVLHFGLSDVTAELDVKPVCCCRDVEAATLRISRWLPGEGIPVPVTLESWIGMRKAAAAYGEVIEYSRFDNMPGKYQFEPSDEEVKAYADSVWDTQETCLGQQSRYLTLLLELAKQKKVKDWEELEKILKHIEPKLIEVIGGLLGLPDRELEEKKADTELQLKALEQLMAIGRENAAKTRLLLKGFADFNSHYNYDEIDTIRMIKDYLEASDLSGTVTDVLQKYIDEAEYGDESYKLQFDPLVMLRMASGDRPADRDDLLKWSEGHPYIVADGFDTEEPWSDDVISSWVLIYRGAALVLEEEFRKSLEGGVHG